MAATSAKETLQAAAAANGNGAVAAMLGFNRLVCEVAGSFTATVNFEGTLDDATWFALGMKTAADGAAATTATAAGVFKMTADMALSGFRARISGFSAGTVTVRILKQR